MLPLAALIAIILGLYAGGFFSGQPQKPSALEPTDLAGTPVAGVVGSMDVSWRYGPWTGPALQFHVFAHDQDRIVLWTAGREQYTERFSGLPCGTPLEIGVTAEGDQLESRGTPIRLVTLPCAAIGTPSPTVAPPLATPTGTSAQPTGTVYVPPSSRMAPPTDLEITNVEKDADGLTYAFVIHWQYPVEDEIAPTDFEIIVNGELYETVGYEGTGFQYSWYVDGQPCGQTMFVNVIAVNGDEEASAEEIAQAEPPC